MNRRAWGGGRGEEARREKGENIYGGELDSIPPQRLAAVVDRDLLWLASAENENVVTLHSHLNHGNQRIRSRPETRVLFSFGTISLIIQASVSTTQF